MPSIGQKTKEECRVIIGKVWSTDTLNRQHVVIHPNLEESDFGPARKPHASLKPITEFVNELQRRALKVMQINTQKPRVPSDPTMLKLFLDSLYRSTAWVVSTYGFFLK